MFVQRLLCALLLSSGCILAQTTTGTLLGTVVDPVDAAVPGIQVDLRNTATGGIITTTTGAEGIFRFNSLVPATYSLTLKPAAGFKSYTQSDIEVTASEIRDLGKITLAIGAINAWNRFAISFRVEVGSYQPGKHAASGAAARH